MTEGVHYTWAIEGSLVTITFAQALHAGDVVEVEGTSTSHGHPNLHLEFE